MKELSIEQKARRYDEAIKKAESLYKAAEPMSGCNVLLETVFPELKESEDERIRNAIIKYLDALDDDEIRYGVSFKDMRAWLEKQGEQKEYTFKSLPRLLDMIVPTSKAKAYCQKLIDTLVNEGYATDAKIVGECLKQMNGEKVTLATMDEKQGEQKPNPCGGCINRKGCINCENGELRETEQKSLDKVEQKFHEGDWITDDTSIFQIMRVENEWYYADDGDKICFDVAHQYYHLWTIQDAKDGDVLYSPCLKLLWIFKSRDTVYCGCNLNYNDGAFCGEGYFKRPTDAIPATKEQRDTLMKAIADAGYTFDFEKKELRKIEQKSVITIPKFKVGDKVKSIIDGFECTIESIDNICYYGDTTNFDIQDQDGWELVEQKSAWSEEDESYLNTTIAYLKDANEFKKTAENCINWLKFLKDRVQPKQEWSEKDNEHVNSLLKRLEGLCRKEFTTTRFAINEDEDWLKSLKGRVLPQQQEWSEEDENRINRLIAYFEDKESFTAEDDIVYANWLKSLKDRVQPKPKTEWD